MIQLYKKIINLLNSSNNIVETRNLKTVELYNYKIEKKFSITQFNKQLNELKDINFPHIDDLEERNNFIIQIKKFIKYFKNDIYSRRVVLQQKYANEQNLASCMSFLQFTFRKNNKNKLELNCHVVMRSQNIENFLYDMASLFIYSNLVLKETKLIVDNINFDIKIISLHKYLND